MFLHQVLLEATQHNNQQVWDATPSIWRSSTESEDIWLEDPFITLAKESEANLVKNFANAYHFHYPQNLSEMSWRCSLLNSLTNGLRGTCFLHLNNMPWMWGNSWPSTQHSSGSSSALLTTLGTLSLLPLSQAEDHPQGKTVQDTMEIQLNTYDSYIQKLKNCCNHDIQ